MRSSNAHECKASQISNQESRFPRNMATTRARDALSRILSTIACSPACSSSSVESVTGCPCTIVLL
eukprot:scaffold37928_cov74-Phaeocystis_antarctica.AAC.7